MSHKYDGWIKYYNDGNIIHGTDDNKLSWSKTSFHNIKKAGVIHNGLSIVLNPCDIPVINWYQADLYKTDIKHGTTTIDPFGREIGISLKPIDHDYTFQIIFSIYHNNILEKDLIMQARHISTTHSRSHNTKIIIENYGPSSFMEPNFSYRIE